MVQIITMLLFLSRSNSSSYSFHPIKALSISTSWIGEDSRPLVKRSLNLSSSKTIEAPVPPKVNDGLITSGKPNLCAISLPFKNEEALSAGATGILILFNNVLNFSRSSVISIASISTPIISTECLDQISFSWASIQRFNAVWPPIVGRTASISSWISRISEIDLVVSGLRYIWSAIDGSVIMVAGFEFIRIVLIPSSRRDLKAWDPE